MIIDVNGFQMYSSSAATASRCCCCTAAPASAPTGSWCSPPATRPASASSSPICADTDARPTRRARSRFARRRRDVLALLDHLGIARVKAIGLSMGAKTLLHMATQQPDRIDAMVLVSATPYFPAPARAAMAQLSRRRILRRRLGRAAAAPRARRRSDPHAVRSDARAQGPATTTWRSRRRCSRRSPRAR